MRASEFAVRLGFCSSIGLVGGLKEGIQMAMRAESPNKPAAPNAGIASRLTIEHRWPGVGEPERWLKSVAL
jgi:hypothetical protein